MANLSITTAWNETAAFARQEAQLLFPIAFLLVALPGAILQAMIPVAPPGQIPETGAWLVLLPVAILASLVGTIAITYLALRPGTSVGEALQVGVRRFLVVLGAALLLGLAGGLLMVPVILLIGGVAVASGGPAAPALALVPLLVVLPIFIFFWIRLMLMTPVAAVEAGGPITIIRRSWALTRGHFWKLLGFVLLCALVSIVIMLAVGAIGGILVFFAAGQPTPGSISMFLILLVSALVQSVVAAIFATLIARIYAQLADAQPSSGT